MTADTALTHPALAPLPAALRSLCEGPDLGYAAADSAAAAARCFSGAHVAHRGWPAPAPACPLAGLVRDYFEDDPEAALAALKAYVAAADRLGDKRRRKKRAAMHQTLKSVISTLSGGPDGYARPLLPRYVQGLFRAIDAFLEGAR